MTYRTDKIRFHKIQLVLPSDISVYKQCTNSKLPAENRNRININMLLGFRSNGVLHTAGLQSILRDCLFKKRPKLMVLIRAFDEIIHPFFSRSQCTFNPVIVNDVAQRLIHLKHHAFCTHELNAFVYVIHDIAVQLSPMFNLFIHE
ncbi:hypothetical protein D3C76_1361410 [compost metagenome]